MDARRRHCEPRPRILLPAGQETEQLFNILNVSTSHRPTADRSGSLPADDRKAKARIRDAAIACIAADGVRGTTVRKVAARAGVSPGLVIHHFGSMLGLRIACDEHVAAVIRKEKTEQVSTPTIDVLGALRSSDLPMLAGYLGQVLTDDSPVVDALVDELIVDAEGYLELGVERGTLQPTTDPRTRAVVLAAWSLGSLVMRRHLHRLLGFDPADPAAVDSDEMAAYVKTVTEIMTNGVIAPVTATPESREGSIT